jgi:N-carbamoylputrescine amidase
LSADVLRAAVIQMASVADTEVNLRAAEAWVARAADGGADVALLPEFFASPYFPNQQREEAFELAAPLAEHPVLERMQRVAKRHNVLLPVTLFERDGPHFFDTLAVVDRDGSVVHVHRKAHIPDGPGYQEKYYFRPGATPLTAVDTSLGRLGFAICWEQWFPEVARLLTLTGADAIFYPSTIGSEPEEVGAIHTQPMWTRAMVGHAVVNSVYVVASNRVGLEGDASYYGGSFIADPYGDTLVAADDGEGVWHADLDLAWARKNRAGFGWFRDRRPDLYGGLTEEP